ncbi:MAG: 30S ribosome-binding factor RbfA [Oscillospiraceae bacterium]|jgi:ribosome-binding factor A|nr:30S ribosome-binding factor RbfA [Oscillospiraceae bacterium]
MTTHASHMSEDIRRELVALVRELKDPRVAGQLLTVVRVELTRDMSAARVYVSAILGIDKAAEAVKGLEKAAGLLRRELGLRLRLRKAPELRFFADASAEYAIHIDKTLHDLGITPEEDTNHDSKL